MYRRDRKTSLEENISHESPAWAGLLTETEGHPNQKTSPSPAQQDYPFATQLGWQEVPSAFALQFPKGASCIKPSYDHGDDDQDGEARPRSHKTA